MQDGGFLTVFATYALIFVAGESVFDDLLTTTFGTLLYFCNGKHNRGCFGCFVTSKLPPKVVLAISHQHLFNNYPKSNEKPNPDSRDRQDD